MNRTLERDWKKGLAERRPLVSGKNDDKYPGDKYPQDQLLAGVKDRQWVRSSFQW